MQYQFFSEFIQEIDDEYGNIVPSLAKGWYKDRENIQTASEIPSKSSISDFFVEITVRGDPLAWAGRILERIAVRVDYVLRRNLEKLSVQQ